MAEYDVVVIGAGSGGYVAAIRCAQLGLKTVCVDNYVNAKGESALGGVCLNVGCIPSKALLDSTHHYYVAKNHFQQHGINIEGASFDVATMMDRKEKIIGRLTDGIAMLFIKNKIKWIKGQARLLSNSRIEVIHSDKKANTTELKTNHIIIATGSSPAHLELLASDGENIVDSTGALSFDEVPRRFGVVGAGVIGLELGTVWNRLGAKTIILNRGEKFLKSVDQQIAQAARTALESQGLDIRTGVNIKQVKQVKKTSKRVAVNYTASNGEHTVQFDKLLVATGRKPNSDKLNAEAVGLHVNARGFIEVDHEGRTNLQGVYAIGDVVRGPMLAHKASEEGMAVAERIAGGIVEIDFNTVPWVIYTSPEIAWVGRTTEELQNMNIPFNSGVSPLSANGRALCMGESAGMVKILSDAKTDRILGVHMLAPNASEFIGEAVLAMEFSASAEDLARTIHAHPTLSEAIHEAALAVDNRPIHR